MTYRVAVCLYGQPRTWRYCVAHIRQQYVNQEAPVKRLSGFHKRTPLIQTNNELIEFDFFVSVKNYNFFNHVDGHRQLQLLGDEEIRDLLQAFAPKLSYISEYEHEKRLTEWPAWGYSAMFHSLHRAVTLKQRYEASQGFTYDTVVLQRYDVVFNPVDQLIKNLIHHGVMPLTLYTPAGREYRFWHEAWRPGGSDLVMVGDSLAIDLISSAASIVWSHPTEEVIDRWLPYGPNTFISLVAHDCNVQVHHHPFSFALVRPNADLSQPLPESFAYHQNFWTSTHPSNR